MFTERSRTDRRALVALSLAFLLLLPAVTVRLNASDEIEYFAWLRSLAFDRDVNFENEYRYFHDQAPEKHQGLRLTFLEDVNEAGRRPNFAPIGTAILWSPFYLAGHLVAVVTGAPSDGFSRPYLVAVTYASAIYGFLSLILAADFTRRAFRLPARAAVWMAWLGTPLLFYMYVAPGFSHAASAFGVSLFLWTWICVRERWTIAGAAALGAVAGLLPMIREQDIFFALGPAIDFAAWALRRMRHTEAGAPTPATGILGPAFAGVAVAAVVYIPQALAYIALNGHFGPTTKVARKMSWSSPHFLGVLGSPEHGLLFWTPLVLLALVGLALVFTTRARFSSDERFIAGLLIAMVVAQAYISGAVESWTVAGSFGQRRFVALTPILVAGLAILMDLVQPKPLARASVVLVAGLAIWWNIGLMALFGLHQMDRQRLELSDNAASVFWKLPTAAPGIAWRYVTDRDSLYDLPRQD